MMQGLGFHHVLIGWVREMLSTTSYSEALMVLLLVSLKGGGVFVKETLCRLTFSRWLWRVSQCFLISVLRKLSFGYHRGCHGSALTHLCFADDLFVFTRGDVASVEILKKALSLFASRSGLSPSLEKSEVCFGNVSEAEKTSILACLPFSHGSFPIWYLGVPLSMVSLRMADFGVLVTRVKSRIHNWKSKFLSFGGRRQLIISVLQ